MNIKIDISGISSQAINQVSAELPTRASAASQCLRNASLEVLRGERSGRVYKKPGTYGKRASKATKSLLPDYGKKLRGGQLYRASAPGEPPAFRTGTLRRSWRAVKYGANHQNPAIESNVEYAGYMENGTPGGKIAPRPYESKIIEKAFPEIEAVYAQPYDISP